MSDEVRKEVRLKEILHKRYNVPIAVENDSNCFALGVSLHEQDNKFKHMVGITLGTGLGCGVVINGKLYRGANGAAGEIGSLPYLDSDVEHYCGSMFFSRFCHKTALQLYSLATNGDAESIEKWREFGCHMGNMVKMVMFAYLTSSSCHPKIFVKEFSYSLMSCHQHSLRINLLVQR